MDFDLEFEKLSQVQIRNLVPNRVQTGKVQLIPIHLEDENTECDASPEKSAENIKSEVTKPPHIGYIERTDVERKLHEIYRGSKKKIKPKSDIYIDPDLVYYFMSNTGSGINYSGVTDYLEGRNENAEKFREQYTTLQNNDLKVNIQSLEDTIRNSILSILNKPDQEKLKLAEVHIDAFNNAKRKTPKIKTNYTMAIHTLREISNLTGCDLFQFYSTMSSIGIADLGPDNSWKEIEIGYNQNIRQLKSYRNKLKDIQNESRGMFLAAEAYQKSCIEDLMRGNLHRETKFKGISFSKMSRDQAIDRIKEYQKYKLITENAGENFTSLPELKESLGDRLKEIEDQEFPEKLNRKGVKWSNALGLIKSMPILIVQDSEKL